VKGMREVDVDCAGDFFEGVRIVLQQKNQWEKQ